MLVHDVGSQGPLATTVACNWGIVFTFGIRLGEDVFDLKVFVTVLDGEYLFFSDGSIDSGRIMCETHPQGRVLSSHRSMRS